MCVTYDPGSREARWARAGHPPPVKLFSGEELVEGRHRLPLGAHDDAGCGHGRVALEPGAGLLLYTDGLTEARARGEQYGTERVGAIVRELAGTPAEVLVGELQRSATEFSGGTLVDDLCLVAQQAA